MSDNIFIIVDGIEYTGWTSVRTGKSIDNLCGFFQFIATSNINEPFPIKVGQQCQIIINDTLFITGWIEKIQAQYSVNEHSVIISGRDRTNDVVDSQIDHIDFNPPTTLEKMTKQVLESLNLSHIQVIDLPDLEPFQDIETDSLGASAFDFLESYAKKRQVLLATTGEGNIIFTRANDDRLNTVLSTARNAPLTILESRAVYDDSKRYNQYVCRGQENTGSAAFFDKVGTAQQSSNIEGSATDNEIRTSRKYFFQPEQNGTEKSNQDRAKWEANYRKSKAFEYYCTVQGFKPLNDSGIWPLNTLVQVVDFVSNLNNVDSILLISDVQFIQSNEEGSKTILKLVDRDSYTTLVNKPEKNKGDFVQGNQFFDRQPQT